MLRTKERQPERVGGGVGTRRKVKSHPERQQRAGAGPGQDRCTVSTCRDGSRERLQEPRAAGGWRQQSGHQ